MSETDEEKLLRHLAELHASVADACDGLPEDAPEHVQLMAATIRPPRRAGHGSPRHDESPPPSPK